MLWVRNSGPVVPLQASVHRAVIAWRMERLEQSEEGDSQHMLTEQWIGNPWDRWQEERSCGNSQGLPKQMGTVVQRQGALAPWPALTSNKG